MTTTPTLVNLGSAYIGETRLPYHHGNLRQALLDRAAEVIAEDGVAALSLRGLARDLGVSHGAPSRHFPDREALLAALAREGFERSVRAMEKGAEAAGPDPVARYRALGRSYVRFAQEEPAYFRAIHHPEVQCLRDPALRAAQQTWLATLRAGVEAARAAGWHPEADADAQLAFSVAAAMGAALLFADGHWGESLGLEPNDALADAVLDLVVHRSRVSALPDPETQAGAAPDPDASSDPFGSDPDRSPAAGKKRKAS